MTNEIETLTFTPNPKDPNGYLVHVNDGEWRGIVYHYGRVWIDDTVTEKNPDGEPVLSFEYDIVEVPIRLQISLSNWREDFKKFAGLALQALISKSIDEQSTVYAGGTGGIVDEN
jgi:hypothetical protein